MTAPQPDRIGRPSAPATGTPRGQSIRIEAVKAAAQLLAGTDSQPDMNYFFGVAASITDYIVNGSI